MEFVRPQPTGKAPVDWLTAAGGGTCPGGPGALEGADPVVVLR
ncbi:hypothetical protein ABT143_28745 [Streptomyces sp. NPDC002033]